LDATHDGKRPWQIGFLALVWIAIGLVPLAAGGLLVALAWLAAAWGGDDSTIWFLIAAGLVAATAVVPVLIAIGLLRRSHAAWLSGIAIVVVAIVIAVLVAWATLAASDGWPTVFGIEVALALGLVLTLHLADRTRRWIERRPPLPTAHRRGGIDGAGIAGVVLVIGLILVGSLGSGLRDEGRQAPAPPPAEVPVSSGGGVGSVEMPQPGPPTIRASSTADAVHPATAAVDGSMDTFWSSGTGAPGWWEIDLGAVRSLDRLELIAEQLPGGSTIHVVSVAGDGQPYREVYRFTGVTDAGQTLTFDPSAHIPDVRYIRISTPASPSWVAWREIFISTR
jgi:F5/8 type C domain